jgi:hypothetical protein
LIKHDPLAFSLNVQTDGWGRSELLQDAATLAMEESMKLAKRHLAVINYPPFSRELISWRSAGDQLEISWRSAGKTRRSQLT